MCVVGIHSFQLVLTLIYQRQLIMDRSVTLLEMVSYIDVVEILTRLHVYHLHRNVLQYILI